MEEDKMNVFNEECRAWSLMSYRVLEVPFLQRSDRYVTFFLFITTLDYTVSLVRSELRQIFRRLLWKPCALQVYGYC
jgi:hypothetical protein